MKILRNRFRDFISRPGRKVFMGGRGPDFNGDGKTSQWENTLNQRNKLQPNSSEWNRLHKAAIQQRNAEEQGAHNNAKAAAKNVAQNVKRTGPGQNEINSWVKAAAKKSPGAIRALRQAGLGLNGKLLNQAQTKAPVRQTPKPTPKPVKPQAKERAPDKVNKQQMQRALNGLNRFQAFCHSNVPVPQQHIAAVKAAVDKVTQLLIKNGQKNYGLDYKRYNSLRYKPEIQHAGKKPRVISTQKKIERQYQGKTVQLNNQYQNINGTRIPVVVQRDLWATQSVEKGTSKAISKAEFIQEVKNPNLQKIVTHSGGSGYLEYNGVSYRRLGAVHADGGCTIIRMQERTTGADSVEYGLVEYRLSGGKWQARLAQNTPPGTEIICTPGGVCGPKPAPKKTVTRSYTPPKPAPVYTPPKPVYTPPAPVYTPPKPVPVEAQCRADGLYHIDGTTEVSNTNIRSVRYQFKEKLTKLDDGYDVFLDINESKVYAIHSIDLNPHRFAYIKPNKLQRLINDDNCQPIYVYNITVPQKEDNTRTQISTGTKQGTQAPSPSTDQDNVRDG